jgi:hypothetical protein
MKPAATEIDRKSGGIRDRPGASSEARTRFDNETFYAGIVQPPAGRDSSRTAADDHGFDVIVRHLRKSSSGRLRQ